MMQRKIAGCLGLVWACLILSACGGDNCSLCVDCPDFTGDYLINQAPQGAICEAYYLATGQFPYEVTVQDGSDLEIMYYGDPDEHSPSPWLASLWSLPLESLPRWPPASVTS